MADITSNLETVLHGVDDVYAAGILDGKTQGIEEQNVAQNWIWPTSQEELGEWVENYGHLYQTGNSILDAFRTSISHIPTNIYDDKTNLKETLEWIKEITDNTKSRVDTFLDNADITNTIDTLLEIQQELERLIDPTELANGIINKADKAIPTTEGNFAALDSNGNLIDSGKAPSSFATPEDLREVDNKFANYTNTTRLNELLNQKQNVIPAQTYDTYGAAAQALEDAKKDVNSKLTNYATKEQLNNEISSIEGELTTLNEAHNRANDDLAALINDKPGLKVKVGEDTRGEVFNILNTDSNLLNHAISNRSQASGMNAIAGSYVFNINAIEAPANATSITFVLDAVETSEALRTNKNLADDKYQLKEEDEVSWDISGGVGNYEAKGIIDTINGTVVTVKLYSAISAEINLPTGKNDYAYFKVLNKPFCGTTLYGTAAHAEGYNTIANAIGAHAEGGNTIAGGKYSHAEGKGTLAGYCSHAEGMNTKAINQQAHAEGKETIATAYNAHAEGKKTLASGQQAHAEGENTKALGNNSHAEGLGSIKDDYTGASGLYSHVEGDGTQASGTSAHAENHGTRAVGNHSHAGGVFSWVYGEGAFAHGHTCIVSRDYGAAFGEFNYNDRNAIFMVGNGLNHNNRKNAFTVNADGTATIQTAPLKDMDVANKKYVEDTIATAKIEILENITQTITLRSPNGTLYQLSVDDNGELFVGVVE